METKEREPHPHHSATDAIEMEAIVGTHIGTEEKHVLGFKLTSWQDKDSETGKSYEVSIPDRSIVWVGKTPARAMAAMLYGVAMLARDGDLDPNEPSIPGVPPIQHVMRVLSDRLAFHVERRREGCTGLLGEGFKPNAHEPTPPDASGATKDWMVRNSEVIAALGTAISALARIKDL